MSQRTGAGAQLHIVELAIRNALAQHNLHKQPMMVAVSGGADSICLLHVLNQISPEFGITLTVAHLNHRLRAQDSNDDAAFAKHCADKMNLPFYTDEIDIADLALRQKQSIELAAREARHAFLSRAADQFGSHVIALAHHGDDQVETLLLRLIRGTGLNGLRGMEMLSNSPYSSTQLLFRPLLTTMRADIEDYCATHQLSYRNDESNSDTQHMRNRVRHEVIPALKSCNVGVQRSLLNFVASAHDDLALLEQIFEETFHSLSNSHEQLNRDAWRALHVSVQRGVLRTAIQRKQGHLQNIRFAAIEEAREVLLSDAARAEIALSSAVKIIAAKDSFHVVLLESSTHG